MRRMKGVFGPLYNFIPVSFNLPNDYTKSVSYHEKWNNITLLCIWNEKDDSLCNSHVTLTSCHNVISCNLWIIHFRGTVLFPERLSWCDIQNHAPFNFQIYAASVRANTVVSAIAQTLMTSVTFLTIRRKDALFYKQNKTKQQQKKRLSGHRCDEIESDRMACLYCVKVRRWIHETAGQVHLDLQASWHVARERHLHL